jgi:hypothetical protein
MTEPTIEELRRLAETFRSPGSELVFLERIRQMEVKGWTPEHDDEHDGFELSAAARCYTIAAEATKYGSNNVTFDGYRPGERIPSSSDWPWAQDSWKPSEGPLRNLVKAGALILAEIDRIVRELLAVDRYEAALTDGLSDHEAREDGWPSDAVVQVNVHDGDGHG